jgi:membrane protein
MQKNWQNLLDFACFVAVRFSRDRCMQIAASLTFTTLLSLVPLITIALALFSAFPVFEDFSTQIKVYLLANLVPEVAGKIITNYMQQFVESAARLTAVGVSFLALTAMTMMLTIDHAFNVIWRVARPRPLFKRLIIYWAVLTLAPLLVGASLSLTSWLVGLSMGYAKHIPVFGIGALKILPVLFTTLAFALLFELVPNRHVPRTHALVGAVAAAIVFETMNRLFGHYISNFATYKLVYGAFASVPIFLLWIYLSWLAILLGAVIAASLSYWHTPVAHSLSPAARLLDALRVLRIMSNGLQDGRVSTIPELSISLRLSYDALEEILGELADGGIVRKVEGNGWLPVRDAEHIRVAELLRLFVLDCAALTTGQDDEAMRRWLADFSAQIEKNADVSLRELFARSLA